MARIEELIAMGARLTVVIVTHNTGMRAGSDRLLSDGQVVEFDVTGTLFTPQVISAPKTSPADWIRTEPRPFTTRAATMKPILRLGGAFEDGGRVDTMISQSVKAW